MISETLPLNEWPSAYLKNLLLDLECASKIFTSGGKPYSSTLDIMSVVKSAIKDAEERENQLPFK